MTGPIHDGRGLLATHLVISAGGHIAIMRGNEHRCDFLDLGPVLQISHASTELSPDLARKLGRQLINWADSKTPLAARIVRGESA